MLRTTGPSSRTVLPEPLRPTISVSGLGKVMTPPCSGLKLRMPLMRSLAQRPARAVLFPARFCKQANGARASHRAQLCGRYAHRQCKAARTKLWTVAGRLRARQRCSAAAHRSTVAIAAVFTRRVARAQTPEQPSAPAGGTRLRKRPEERGKSACWCPLSRELASPEAAPGRRRA